MKSFRIVLILMALGFIGAPVFADCLATNDQCQTAWDLKKEAVSARESGDFDTAASKYGEAAKAHPQEAYAASYLMNEVGCLLSSSLDPQGNYSWDDERGKANASTAYTLLDQVQTLLDKAKSDKCEYVSGVIGKTQAWHDNQLSFLQKMVPQVTK